jgi:hypothetical protein
MRLTKSSCVFAAILVATAMMAVVVIVLILGVIQRGNVALVNAKSVVFAIHGVKIGDPPPNNFPARPQQFDTTGTKFREEIEVSGKRISVSYEFIDGKLESVFLSFVPESFDDLVAAYTEKLGSRPHHSREETLTTRGGLEYTNVIVRWKTNAGTFSLQKYASSADRGCGSIYSDKSLKRWQRMDEDTRRETKSKL